MPDDAGQLALDLTDAPQWVSTADPDSIEHRFWAFHQAHAEVYGQLVDLSRQALRAGRKRIGMKMLFEVVRWQRFVRPDVDEEFKLNNNYTSRYARLIMEQEQDLAGIFETRRLTTASALDDAAA